MTRRKVKAHLLILLLSLLFILSISAYLTNLLFKTTYNLKAITSNRPDSDTQKEGSYTYLLIKPKQTKNQKFVKSRLKSLSPHISKLEPLFRNKFSYLNVYLLKVQKNKSDALLKKLQNLEWVEYAYEDATFTLLSSNDRITPNDPYYPSQWQYKTEFNMEKVWQKSPTPEQYTIAIIDSGLNIYHEDIKNKLWVNQGEVPNNNIDDDGNGYIDDIYGWNFFKDNNNLFDLLNHGTAVAGAAAAESNNKKGITSPSWYGKIMGLNVTSFSTKGYAYNVYRALEYALSFPEVKVINLSLKISHFTPELKEILETTIKENRVLIVASAGNQGSFTLTYPIYPAILNGIMAVSSYGPKGFSYFSNYGPHIDVAAPGEYIVSPTAYGDDYYAEFRGTSFSAPLVSGLALFIFNKYADLNLKANEVAQMIKIWADCPEKECPKDSIDFRYGFGKVNPTASVINRCEGGPFLRSQAFIDSIFPPPTVIDSLTLKSQKSISQIIVIKGTVKSNVFLRYDLQIAPTTNITKWSRTGIKIFNQGKLQGENVPLGILFLDSLKPNTYYTLRLRVFGKAPCLNNIVAEHYLTFYVPKIYLKDKKR